MSYISSSYIHFPLQAASALQRVTTMHGRTDLPDFSSVFQEFADMPLVSISDQPCQFRINKDGNTVSPQGRATSYK